MPKFVFSSTSYSAEEAAIDSVPWVHVHVHPGPLGHMQIPKQAPLATAGAHRHRPRLRNQMLRPTTSNSKKENGIALTVSAWWAQP